MPTKPSTGGLEPQRSAGPSSKPVSFAVFRQPRKSSAAPLQLPARTAIDLNASGSDSGSLFFRAQANNDPLPVVVMFSPNGSLESVYCWNSTATDYGPIAVTEPVYLLVGQLARVRSEFPPVPLSPTPNRDDLPNWADLTSIWISLQPQTGYINTSEMYPVETDPQLLWAPATDWPLTEPAWPHVPARWRQAISTSRNFARESQMMGGR